MLSNKCLFYFFLVIHYLYPQPPGKIEYAPVGAKWVYDLMLTTSNNGYINFINGEPEFLFNGYIEYTVQKDTNIQIGTNVLLCKKIIVSGYYFDFSSFPYNADFKTYLPYVCLNERFALTFKRNDTIFWSVANSGSIRKFFPIVVHYKDTINKNTKDFWVYYGSFTQNCPSISSYSISSEPFTSSNDTKITEIDTIYLFNDTLRRYKFNNPFKYSQIKNFYIENIGFYRGGLVAGSVSKSIHENIWIDRLRCYYHPQLGWATFNPANGCYYHNNTVGFKNYENNNFSIYYYDKKIFIKNYTGREVKCKIYNLHGEKVFEHITEYFLPVQVDLPSGIYLAEVDYKILKLIVE